MVVSKFWDRVGGLVEIVLMLWGAVAIFNWVMVPAWGWLTAAACNL
jgi:hypothetical protein